MVPVNRLTSLFNRVDPTVKSALTLWVLIVVAAHLLLLFLLFLRFLRHRSIQPVSISEPVNSQPLPPAPSLPAAGRSIGSKRPIFTPLALIAFLGTLVMDGSVVGLLHHIPRFAFLSDAFLVSLLLVGLLMGAVASVISAAWAIARALLYGQRPWAVALTVLTLLGISVGLAGVPTLVYALVVPSRTPERAARSWTAVVAIVSLVSAACAAVFWLLAIVWLSGWLLSLMDSSGVIPSQNVALWSQVYFIYETVQPKGLVVLGVCVGIGWLASLSAIISAARSGKGRWVRGILGASMVCTLVAAPGLPALFYATEGRSQSRVAELSAVRFGP